MLLLNGKNICDCKKISCLRHGRCDQCVAYHKGRRQPPACMRERYRKTAAVPPGRMLMLLPLLGLFFGAAAGLIVSLLAFPAQIPYFTAAGAGLGLLSGLFIYLPPRRKNKDHEGRGPDR